MAKSKANHKRTPKHVLKLPSQEGRHRMGCIPVKTRR
jgi:hypothetical protein